MPNSTVAIGTEGSHTFSISLAYDAVKKIDAKYLPSDIGGGLPDCEYSDSGKVLTVDSSGNAVWKTPASGLPTVYTSDNDKVLKVVNGVWKAAEAPSGLPNITTDDNGKVLEVVDGVWTSNSIENSTIKTYIDTILGDINTILDDINGEVV